MRAIREYVTGNWKIISLVSTVALCVLCSCVALRAFFSGSSTLAEYDYVDKLERVGVVYAVEHKNLLSHLAERPSVIDVSFVQDSDVQDRHLKGIETLNSLERLDLSNTNVTDEGIKHLAELASLRVLNLEGTWITDQAIQTLAHLKSLEEVDIRSTQITIEGARSLKHELGDALVLW